MAAAADGLYKSTCIYGCDTEIDRRPYHRNCGCALHRSSSTEPNNKTKCSHTNINFPIRKSWSEGCLALAASACSSSSSIESSPANSPAVAGAVMGRSHHRRLSSLDEGQEETLGGGVFFKI